MHLYVAKFYVTIKLSLLDGAAEDTHTITSGLCVAQPTCYRVS